MTGVLQGCLLAMGITFELRELKKRKAQREALEENGVADEDGDERTRLLENER